MIIVGKSDNLQLSILNFENEELILHMYDKVNLTAKLEDRNQLRDSNAYMNGIYEGP